MRRRNGQRLDLKLNLTLPTRTNSSQQLQQRFNTSPSRSATESPPSSCVSSDGYMSLDDNDHDDDQINQLMAYEYCSSPEVTSMVLVGCSRCLMYVLLSQDDPKCPRCKSTVLLEFGNGNDDADRSGNKTGGSRNNRRNSNNNL